MRLFFTALWSGLWVNLLGPSDPSEAAAVVVELKQRSKSCRCDARCRLDSLRFNSGKDAEERSCGHVHLTWRRGFHMTVWRVS